VVPDAAMRGLATNVVDWEPFLKTLPVVVGDLPSRSEADLQTGIPRTNIRSRPAPRPAARWILLAVRTIVAQDYYLLKQRFSFRQTFVYL
jgi:hypothetical protein